MFMILEILLDVKISKIIKGVLLGWILFCFWAHYSLFFWTVTFLPPYIFLILQIGENTLCSVGGGHSTAPTNEAWIDWLTSKYNILDIDTVGSVLKSTSCRCFLGCYSVPITILFCSTTITCSGILYLHFKSDYQFYSWIILWACDKLNYCKFFQ